MNHTKYKFSKISIISPNSKSCTQFVGHPNKSRPRFRDKCLSLLGLVLWTFRIIWILLRHRRESQQHDVTLVCTRCSEHGVCTMKSIQNTQHTKVVYEPYRVRKYYFKN